MELLADTLPCRPRGGVLPPEVQLSEADGSLRVGFAPVLDVELRLSSWSDGLELRRRDGDQWVPEHDDPQLFQLASVEDLPQSHPFRRFAAAIPEEARRSVGRYASWQLTALRLLRHCPQARDLARTAPTLFWLVASVVDRHSVAMSFASLVLERRRVEVLRWCVGDHASRSLLRFLGKVRVREYARRDLEVLERALRDAELAAWFRHEREVELDDVRRVVVSPWMRDYPFFREAIREARQRPQVMSELAHLLSDAERLAASLGRSDFEAVMRECRSMTQLGRLHDRWTDQVNRQRVEVMRLHLVVELGSDRFPAPPRPGTRDIVPITSLEDLASEALEMRHCALSYARDICEGKSYVYRVLAPERATLELRCTGSALSLAQLRGRQNSEVGRETERAVQSWLCAR